MRPPEFQEQDVIEAGKQLQNENRNVTGFSLRGKLGGGNAKRLRQVWEEYQASQTEKPASSIAELPVEVAEQLEAIKSGLLDSLTGLVLGLNDRAVRAAERRTAELVKSTGEQREQAERELSDASVAVEDLEAIVADLRDQLRGVNESLSKSEAARQKHEIDLARAHEQITSMERAAKETAAAHSERLAVLSAELEDARRAGQLARDEHSQALGNLQAAERQRADDVELISKMRVADRELNQAVTRANAQLEAQTATLQQVREELASAKNDAKAVTEQLRACQERATAAETRAEVAESRAAVFEQAMQKLPKADAKKPAAKS